MAKDKKRGFFFLAGLWSKRTGAGNRRRTKSRSSSKRLKNRLRKAKRLRLRRKRSTRRRTEHQDAEAFAAEVVEVTGQVVESEQPQAVVDSPAVETIAEPPVV
ncbi:Signal recognition particle receptor protein FtsY [Klebsiella oxytoca]|nr:Signal recognition particle receptor protein FtsY [Klebsiella oxytoca]